MRKNDNFTSAAFLTHLEVADKKDLFERLSRLAADLPPAKAQQLGAPEILDALNTREAQMSTAVGNSVIFPHARLPKLDRLGIIIATLKNPLHCQTPDHQPLQIVCLLLIPESKPMDGLKFIARFANYARMPELREKLLNAQTPADLQSLLSYLNTDSSKAIVAGDLMAKPRFSLTTDMPLKEATSLMAQWRTPVVPVLDGKRLVGQIACSNLFTLGIPDFFSQLKSVGFIRFFDPFEKYFKIEANSHVGQAMSTDYGTFSEDATMIEIVFAISILKYPQVYVVNKNQELLGIIDQTLLLEKIINL